MLKISTLPLFDQNKRKYFKDEI